jgi:HAD superfamily hydrolase (TIGR01509 family)
MAHLANLEGMPAAFDAVLFDFSGTLFSVEEPARWLARAAAAVGAEIPPEEAPSLLDRLLAAGRPGGPEPRRVPPELAEVYARRDLSGDEHRRAYVGLLSTVALPHPGLADALYERLFDPDGWVPYADLMPVVTALRERGVRTAVVSNIGWDLRPLFAEHGLANLFDAHVFSCEVGVMKPDVEIFELACAKLDVSPGRALMVGDHRADGGAVHAGLRTLLLPASPPGAVHGLDAVLTLCG